MSYYNRNNRHPRDRNNRSRYQNYDDVNYQEGSGPGPGFNQSAHGPAAYYNNDDDGNYQNYQHCNQRGHNYSRLQTNDDDGNYQNASGSTLRQHRQRGHPKHLRGAEIGMHYAKKNKEKTVKKDYKKAPSITLNDDKIREIRNVLNLPSSHNINHRNIVNSLIYSDNVNSDFKKEFLHIKNTSFNDNVKENLNKAKAEIMNGKIDNESLNESILNNSLNKNENDDYNKIQIFRYNLPSHQSKHIILNALKNNQIILISGETGCGKTTQVPQFILDEAILSKQSSNCHIVCTQPRRISAISIAERVAAERGERLGQSIGYHIKLDSVLPRSTGGTIVFCTTGIILKIMESDPGFSTITHLIIDEIHERDSQSDLLLALLKMVLPYRPDLKIILMSATLRADMFSKYYFNCPLIHIKGKMYPVQTRFLEDIIEKLRFFNFTDMNLQQRNLPKWKRHTKKFKNQEKTNYEFIEFIEPHIRAMKNHYSRQVLEVLKNPESEKINLDLIEALIFNISENEAPGAILVFLTGYDLISKLHTQLKKSRHFVDYKYQIYPLHSMMPGIDQKNIFRVPPSGVRKIILSTNIAETSITIDDVVYVIDCGKQKNISYNEEENIQTFKEEWCSLANITQRRGRAGRVQPGICFHLFTRARAMILQKHQIAEILRTRLDKILLTMKILHIQDIKEFLSSLIDVPSETNVLNSIKFLKSLNAFDDNENITPLGLHLARLPMDPQSGKMVLLSSIFSCVDPITSIAASLSFKDAFYRPLGKENIVDDIKQNFANSTRSDHLMLANVLEEWMKIKSNDNDYNFCRQNFLSWSTLKQLENMKSQFTKILHQSKFVANDNSAHEDNNINSNNAKLLKGIISAGLYPNVAKIMRIRRVRNRPDATAVLKTLEERRLEIHPSSVNAKQAYFNSNFMVYHMKQKSSVVYLYDTTSVNLLPLLFFGDDITYEVHKKQEYISMAEGFLLFKCNHNTYKLIMDLRLGLNNLLEQKICQPSPIKWKKDEGMLLRAIIHLITIEGSDEFSNDCDFEYSDNEEEDEDINDEDLTE